MNIFATSPDPYQAAEDLCDQHVCKMALETAQMLCTALRRHGVEDDRLWKSAYQQHPCTVWAGDAKINFQWLLHHGLAICAEYSARYNKVHKAEAVILLCGRLASRHDVNLPYTGSHFPETFPQCMPDQYKHEDPHRAYRRYIVKEKTFARYRYTKRPAWVPLKSTQP